MDLAKFARIQFAILKKAYLDYFILKIYTVVPLRF